MLMSVTSQSRRASLPASSPPRVIIDTVLPQADGGRFPVKRSAGAEIVFAADIYADGHDSLAAVLRYRNVESEGWQEIPLEEVGNDHWRAHLELDVEGRYEYTVHAWIDRFASWRKDLAKKVAAEQDVAVELLDGAALLSEAGRRATGPDAEWLRNEGAFLAQEGAATPSARNAGWIRRWQVSWLAGRIEAGRPRTTKH